MQRNLTSALTQLQMQETLRSLDLPVEAVPLFLQHIAQFCECHGGEKYYQELLNLVDDYAQLKA